MGQRVMTACLVGPVASRSLQIATHGVHCPPQPASHAQLHLPAEGNVFDLCTSILASHAGIHTTVLIRRQFRHILPSLCRTATAAA